MPHLRFGREIEKFLVDFVLGQSRYRQRGDKLATRRGQNGAHRGTCFTQAADQFQRLVGSDATANDEKDSFAAQVHRSSQPHHSYGLCSELRLLIVVTFGLGWIVCKM